LKAKLDAGEDVFVLDVREPHEYQICKRWISDPPWVEVPKRGSRTGDSSREIVAHCRSGVRSAKAVDFLRPSRLRKVK